jgi:hypothetical protein
MSIGGTSRRPLVPRGPQHTTGHGTRLPPRAARAHVYAGEHSTWRLTLFSSSAMFW